MKFDIVRIDDKIYLFPVEDKFIKVYFEGDSWVENGVFHKKTTLEEVYIEADDDEKKEILEWCKENPEYAKALSVLVGWWDNPELIRGSRNA